MPGKRGRPRFGKEPLRNVNVMLDQDTIDQARAIGGSVSRGLRMAVKNYEELSHEKFTRKNKTG
jgi:post-segregation antitoxin (ccd killing protein)